MVIGVCKTNANITSGINMEKLRAFLNRTHFFQRFAEYRNFIFGIVKIIMGVFTTEFILISGVYSILIAFALRTYLRGEKDIRRAKHAHRDEYFYFQRIAFFVLAGGIFHAAYMVRLFFLPPSAMQAFILIIVISVIAGIEIIFAIIKLIIAKTVLKRGLRLINLTSALVSVGAAVAGILSINTEPQVAGFYNATIGVSVGLLCVLVGLLMITWYHTQKNRKHKEAMERRKRERKYREV